MEADVYRDLYHSTPSADALLLHKQPSQAPSIPPLALCTRCMLATQATQALA